ncbi:hemicentin-1-like isoform X2 [Mya arenaria]|uniref:hemicentin-1-like isoform X2 n=1 Tax=Mya arenaria TaxID=6604 RepID=UPI0022DFB0B3|nr:hemicentin-1-like isoform X2 [Mya arenaria]
MLIMKCSAIFFLIVIGRIYSLYGCQDNVRVYSDKGQRPILNFSVVLDTSKYNTTFSVTRYDGTRFMSMQYMYGQPHGSPSLFNGCTLAPTANLSRGILDVKLGALAAGDQGMYKLSGSASSKCYTLYFLGIPTRPTISSTGTIYEGVSLPITCSSTSTTNPSNHSLTMGYSWTRGGSTIIAGGRFSFDNNLQRRLTIANITRNDNKTVIRCTATEERGKSSLSSAYMIIFTLCSNTLTNFSGVIESPNFPNPYPHNLNCTWVIDTTIGNTVYISFSSFSIESNCQYDHLQINDGDQPTSTSLGTFCGSNLPRPISSSTDKVWINFVTDSSVAKNGFRLEYITHGCGGYLHTPTGSFTSPNYPHPYPHQRQCEWTIVADTRSYVQLTIETIDLETQTYCDYDVLDIYDGPDDTAPRLAQLCHHQSSPQVLFSTGNTMFVRFKSDGSIAGNGFSVTYRTVTGGCGGNFTIPRGTIVSKNYPNKYPHNTDCEWLITVKVRQNIGLEFTDFDVGGSSDCRYDYVAVYDGPSVHATELMKHCGNSLPNPAKYRSLSNQLFIRMKTDGSASRRGFMANYTTVSDVSISPSQTSYTVTERQTLVPITCSATCYPVCLYTWSKSSVTVSSTATLNLHLAERAEAGSYFCTAMSPGLSVSRSGPVVNITVRYGPDNMYLSPSTTSYTVTEGNNIGAITCSAACSPACTYTWSRLELTVSSTATLNLGQADRGEAGSYICTARNPGLYISRNGTRVSVSVRYGPDIVSLSPSSTSYTVTEGNYIGAISCAATCNPACTYQWSRSGVTVSSSSTLNLGQVVSGEAGSYVCTARNPGLNISRTGPAVNISVKYGPDHVSLSPSTTSYTVTEGHTLVPITCSAKCYPACTYTWSRSGVTVSSTATLNLHQAERAEAGTYVCTARNPILSVSRSGPVVNVTVRYGPDNASLSPSTTSYAVTEGNNIGAITCSATCYPACTYTWSRSGSTVSSTATLNLGQADRGEAGSYVCTARNPGSNISRNGPTVNISVRYGPENVSLSPSKTSCTVNEGDIINAIMCSAMCYPACTYTWSRSGVTVSSTATLNLHQAERVEAGSYVCTARNPSLSVSRNGPVVKVTVRYGPDNVNLSPSTTSYTVTERDNIGAITCSATCNPACTYTWSRSGSTVSSSATLNFGQADRGEAGSYVCTSRNPGSNISRNGSEVNVNVRYGPSAVALSPSTLNYTKNDGDTLAPITCSADCFPACNISWRRISGISDIVSTNASFNLRELNRTGTGRYKCEAINPYTLTNTTSKDVTINVRYGPDVITLNESNVHTVTEGDAVSSIYCSADCWPGCVYTWTNLTDNQPKVFSAILVFGTVNRYDAGDYMCLARNSAPQFSVVAAKQFTLRVQYAPDVVISQSNTSLRENSPLNLRCKASGVPAVYNYTGFEQRVGDMVVPNSHVESPGVMESISVNIPSVQFQDTGIYTCYVHNNITGLNKKLIQTTSQNIEVSASPQFFLEKTEFVGKTSTNITIDIPFVSFPEYTKYSVIRHDGQQVSMNEKYTIHMRNESVNAVFYGQQVNISGKVLQVTINDLAEMDFGIYNIQITNYINTANFSIDIQSTTSDTSARKSVGPVIGGTVGGLVVALLAVFVIVVFIKRKDTCSIKFAERKDPYQNTHSGQKTVSQGVGNPQYDTAPQTYEELSMATDIGVYTDLKNVNDGTDNPNVYAQLAETSLSPASYDDTVEKEDHIYINLMLKNPAQL